MAKAQPRTFTLTQPVELYSANGQQHLRAYAAVYFNGQPETEFSWGNYVERIAPGAFQRALSDGRNVIARYDHEDTFFLGQTIDGTLRVWADEKGLMYDIPLDPASPDHQKVVSLLERHKSHPVIKGSSFGMWPSKSRYTVGETEGKTLITHEDIDLYEVSPVREPAFSGTGQPMIRAQADDNWLRTLEILARHKTA